MIFLIPSIGCETLQHRIEAFDGLRGVAIALVMVHHLHFLNGRPAGPEIFFALSGYLITQKLAARSEQVSLHYIFAFYKRRAIRLLPPLAALLAGVAVACTVFSYPDDGLARSFLGTLSFSINWQQAMTSWRSYSLFHLWSLSAEQQFYVVWPLSFFVLPKHLQRPLLMVLLLALTAWRLYLCTQGASFDRLYYGLDTHADGLILGCLLGLTPLTDRHKAVLRRASPLLLGFILLIALAVPAPSPLIAALETSVTAVVATCLIAAVPQGGLTACILNTRPMRALGLMSYSLYLWHVPVFMMMPFHGEHGKTAAKLALSFLLATIAYLLIERPLSMRNKRPGFIAASWVRIRTRPRPPGHDTAEATV